MLRLSALVSLAATALSACAAVQPRELTTAWSSVEGQCARWIDGRFYCTSAPDRRFGTPVPIAAQLPLVEFSGSEWSGCGMDASRNAYCWRHVQSWVDGREVLTLVVDTLSARSDTRVTSISSTGDDWVCGTDEQGLAWCGGMVPARAQGCATDAANILCRPQPARVHNSIRFSQVEVGEAPHGPYGFACGLAMDGQVYCWNRDGVFLFTASGNPDLCRVPRLKSFNCTQEARPVHTSARFTSITAGGGYACGITTSADLMCWGHGGPLLPLEAQRGCDHSSDFICTAVPSRVVGMPKVIAASASDLHTCAITTEYTAVCWGNGSMSQLGGRSNTSTSFGDGTLVTVDGKQRWRQISAGPFLTCGITLEHEWYCWGQQPVDNPLHTGPQRIPDPVPPNRQ